MCESIEHVCLVTTCAERMAGCKTLSVLFVQAPFLAESGDITQIDVLARKTAEGVECLPKIYSMKLSSLLPV